MSHYEVDRRSSEHQAVRNTLQRPGETATLTPQGTPQKIDTDLDNGVDYIDGGHC